MRWTALSSILAATPGALTQMVALAVETRSDAVGVSIAQTLRVVLLVAFLPVILAFAGYSIGAGGLPRAPTAPLSSLPILLAGSLLLGYLFFRLHFPGRWLFGAMFGAGLLHGDVIVDGGLPPWVVSVATIGVGTMAGTRFAGLALQTLLRYLAAGAGSLLVAGLVMAAFLLLDVWIAGIRVQDGAMSLRRARWMMMTVALTMHLVRCSSARTCFASSRCRWCAVHLRAVAPKARRRMTKVARCQESGSSFATRPTSHCGHQQEISTLWRTTGRNATASCNAPPSPC